MVVWKENKPYIKYYLEGRGKRISNLWKINDGNIDGNKKASNILKDLFKANNIFSNPKPVSLIKKIINISNVKSGDIILDFFAGSGTTAQAVMELNKEDGGNRKFILVQLDEKITLYKKYKKSDKLNNIKRGDFILNNDDGNKIEEDFDLQSESYKFCVKNNLPKNISSITKERVIRSYNKLYNK